MCIAREDPAAFAELYERCALAPRVRRLRQRAEASPRHAAQTIRQNPSEFSADNADKFQTLRSALGRLPRSSQQPRRDAALDVFLAPGRAAPRISMARRLE